jgi:hypothetical protein
VGLLGRSAQLTGPQMQAFASFILEVMLPPNPIRSLDNSLTTQQQAGHDFYFGPTSDLVQTCNGCHQLNPAAGDFGTDGKSSFENETQDFKIPHLRNLYQKVGMFGMPAIQFINAGNNGSAGAFTIQPDQVRGFGFLHDGSVDTLFRFHNATVFNTGFQPNGCNQACADQKRRQVEQFMFAFDSDLAPVVGQQVTLTNSNGGVVGARIDLLKTRANAGECELAVKGVINNTAVVPNVLEQRGALWLPGESKFATDRSSQPHLTDAQVRALANTAGQELTFTCVPPGEGVRVGIDRDEDGFLDRDELDQGSDPADPLSVPGGTTTSTSIPPSTTTSVTTPGSTTTSTSTTSTTLPLVTIATRILKLRDDATPPTNPARRKITFRSSTRLDPPANRIVLAPPGSAGDPTVGGATLAVYNSAGSGEKVLVSLPPLGPFTGSGWSIIGTPTKFKGYRYRGKDPNGPISAILVQADKIRVNGGESNWTYTLNEAFQGRIAVRLTLGTGTVWCADAPAKPPAAVNDKVDRFIAGKTPAPVSCPPLP